MTTDWMFALWTNNECCPCGSNHANFFLLSLPTGYAIRAKNFLFAHFPNMVIAETHVRFILIRTSQSFIFYPQIDHLFS